MLKIISIVGARPQFIKLSPVSKELRKNFEEIIIHTGQHYDYKLSESFFQELEIPTPKYNLEVGSGSHIYQMVTIMLKLETIFNDEKPDGVVVFGDTNSTSAAAIVSSKMNIPLFHVEAGLREFNKLAPEEINKLLTDSVTDIYFSPTDTGVTNLKNEGKIANVHNVGDVGIDLIFQNTDKINSADSVFKSLNLVKDNYYLFTCHRAANTDSKINLENILSALVELKKDVIFPIHPRTKKAIDKFNLGSYLDHKHIHVIEPVGFWEIQNLVKNSHITITDSGGLIKEAYYHRVRAVIVDLQTEWVETIDEGWNFIAGPTKENILKGINEYIKPTQYSNCLGDGTASVKIAQIIKEYLNGKK